MKITVLNGSPKGMVSVTMQHVLYIQKEFPQHEIEIVNISQRIKRIEKNQEVFDGIIATVEASDAVLWATPLYYFVVPGQYKQFIELVFERGVLNAFRDKYAAVLTTSIHFFDHTAHNYLQGICDDLGMKYVETFSAHMSEMASEGGRKNLQIFADNFINVADDKLPTQRYFPPLSRREFEYEPGPQLEGVNAGDMKVLLVSDAEPGQANMNAMIKRFQAAFNHEIEVVNLHDVDIKGGCQGCLQCGYDNDCSYAGKDGFIDFYEQKIKKADILIFAGTIKDRFFSSLWKKYFDRSFYNGHASSLDGKQMAYIISGPLSQIPNFQQVLQAYTEMQLCNLGGIVTDEYGDSQEIDGLIQNLAKNLVVYAESGYIRPHTFLHVGGIKLFRDEVFSNLRMVFQADHKKYKERGVYDFPTRNILQRFMNTVAGLIFKIPSMRKGYQRMLKPGQIMGLKKILESE
jgi:multimeric flavodoxin WrbA